MKSNNYYEFMDFMKTVNESNKFPLKNHFSVFECDLVFKFTKKSNFLDRLRRKFDLQVTEVMKRYNLLDDDMREKMHSLWQNTMEERQIHGFKKYIDIIFSGPGTLDQNLMWDDYKGKVFKLIEQIADKKMTK